MKILRNICLGLLGVGLVLCLGGAVLGGTVYTSWWNGAPHTWREALNAGKNYVLHEWYDDNGGYHRGWFDRNDDDWFDSDDGWFDDHVSDWTNSHHGFYD